MLGKCEVNLNLTEWRKEITQMSDIFKLYRPFYSTTNNVLITDKRQNEVYSVVIITACFFFSIFDFDTIPNRSEKYKYKIYKTATRNPGFSSQQQT